MSVRPVEEILGRYMIVWKRDLDGSHDMHDLGDAFDVSLAPDQTFFGAGR